jgi:outer membrane protein TolC
VAVAAYFPNVTLTAEGGLESASLVDLFISPSRFCSLGRQLVQKIFDGGRRRFATEQARASYGATVAAHRESVLTSFQDVEDGLSTPRVLAHDATDVTEAVAAAQESLAIANNRYVADLAAYLEVIRGQNALLTNQRTAADIQTRRIVASVMLIKALGGGWTMKSLPIP